MAYGRIYSNGAMTPGVTQETVDGMSRGKIGRIIDAVRHERGLVLRATEGRLLLLALGELFLVADDLSPDGRVIFASALPELLLERDDFAGQVRDLTGQLCTLRQYNRRDLEGGGHLAEPLHVFLDHLPLEVRLGPEVTVPATSYGALQDSVESLDLQAHVPGDDSVNVTGRCAMSTLRNLAYGCQNEPARTITPAERRTSMV